MEQSSSTVTKVQKPKTAESIMIPKHRFDCVNLCLKETKIALKERVAELKIVSERVHQLESALLDSKIEAMLSRHRAKNLTAAKALINSAELKIITNGTVEGLEQQIISIKKTNAYLFENSEKTSYVLVPVSEETPLNKSIADYFKQHGETK